MQQSSPPSAPPLAVTRRGATAILTLARPAHRNALDAELVEALIGAVEEAQRTGVRLLVLQGGGAAFSAGFDLARLDEQSDGDLALRFLRVEHLLQRVHHAPFMTLALVHGACYGAAADLVASCTIRVAAPATRFRLPGSKFAVALGTRRLAELVGRDAALDLLLTAKTFGTEHALAIGFLTRVAPAGEWPAIIAAAEAEAALLPAESLARLAALTRADSRDADLAALARSLAEPGLKARIAAYVRDLKT